MLAISRILLRILDIVWGNSLLLLIAYRSLDRFVGDAIGLVVVLSGVQPLAAARPTRRLAGSS